MTMNKQEIDSMVVDDLDLRNLTAAHKGKNVRRSMAATMPKNRPITAIPKFSDN